MEDRMPKAGELYRHFKNKLYQVITVAKHSETQELMVVYQALYGDYGTYVRPLEMFVSKVDRVKYPNVEQEYRFQKIDRSTLDSEKADAAEVPAQNKMMENKVAEHKTVQAVGEQVEKVSEPVAEPEEGGANPLLMEFLDADTFEDKYKVLVKIQTGHKNEINDRLINDLAVVLDVVVPEGDIDTRFHQIKTCVDTFRRYEVNRLR